MTITWDESTLCDNYWLRISDETGWSVERCIPPDALRSFTFSSEGHEDSEVLYVSMWSTRAGYYVGLGGLPNGVEDDDPLTIHYQTGVWGDIVARDAEGQFTKDLHIAPGESFDLLTYPVIPSGEDAYDTLSLYVNGRVYANIRLNGSRPQILRIKFVQPGTYVILARTGVYGTNQWTDLSRESVTVTVSADAEEPTELSTLILPADLREIEAGAFEGTSAEKVIVPDGCIGIGSKAFAGCGNLKVIVIPSSVKTIAQDAFDGLSGFRIITPSGSPTEGYATVYGWTASFH